MRRATVILWLGLAWLAGCGTTPPGTVITDEVSAPLATPAPDAKRFVVDADDSRVRFIVRRAGTLARLGHNHVILARRIEGEIALAPEVSRTTVSLQLPVAGFEVDPPAERAALGEGFEPVPEQAVIGTRRNMLGPRVLDVTRHATVRIDTVAVAGSADAVTMTLRIRLRDVSRDLTVPVAWHREGDTLSATADFEIRQSDFGITPLSVLGGALQVDDGVPIRLHIVARAVR
jgi:polyisoprenoid-binding protein YceI